MNSSLNSKAQLFKFAIPSSLDIFRSTDQQICQHICKTYSSIRSKYQGNGATSMTMALKKHRSSLRAHHTCKEPLKCTGLWKKFSTFFQASKYTFIQIKVAHTKTTNLIFICSFINIFHQNTLTILLGS